jgi:hypothetical protein
VVRNLLSLDRPIGTVVSLVPQSRSNSKLFSDVTLSTSDFTGGRSDFIVHTLFDISNILDGLRKLAVTVSYPQQFDVSRALMPPPGIA